MVVPFNIARYLAYNSLDNIVDVIFLKYSDIKVLGVGLCVIPSFGNIMMKIFRPVGSISLLCNIELEICSVRLDRFSPSSLTISATKPSASCAFRTFNWRNTCCNSFYKIGGIS